MNINSVFDSIFLKIIYIAVYEILVMYIRTD